jgi:hypothetical protein
MLIALLALVGVPLWICALALLTLVLRNRKLRKRPGNIPARLQAAGRKRWTRGHGLWVHDVIAFRGSPAAWKESLLWASDVAARPATQEELKKLRRLGADLVIVVITPHTGHRVCMAARAQDAQALLGPGGGRPLSVAS